MLELRIVRCGLSLSMVVVTNVAAEHVSALGCIAPVLANPEQISTYLSLGLKRVWAPSDLNVVPLLDSGVETVIVEFSILQLEDAKWKDAFSGIDPSRLCVKVDRAHWTPENVAALKQVFHYFMVNADNLVALEDYGVDVIWVPAAMNLQTLRAMRVHGDNFMVDVSVFGENVIDAFVELLFVTVQSDRQDGLVPTVVVDEQKVSLGLCYSSQQSVAEALKTMSGVYMSRKRGLWYKGATSGATQQLLQIELDCDSDTFCFTVVQTSPGFCHLNTRSCWGKGQGINGLFGVLQDRATSAPAGSYTQRLFKDKELLHSKICEEAEELCTATSADEIAWEAADLIYFALVKCAASGVTISDVEKHLNKRSMKITRRPGNAKPKAAEPVKEPASSLPIYHMCHYQNNAVSEKQAKELLLRPIINTDEIMERVRPIVKKVREEGDSAIRHFTKQYDNVVLDDVVLKAPFSAELMVLDPKVKDAVDLAYANVEKFHSAQLESEPLVVETMPGVVCTRFLRPIERVGLYVPGGTAILPSSTLMLGIPAQVAGCKQIVFATPPKPDGSIAPEVVYVAHKVGASMIVKAGGAQAVAAMAYGTESVPKVDKICGPGNQYVTAAKMVAQSDSSALLSIDMPAGPSELLVIADKSANISFVVSDLLSQAEHGVDSQVVLVAVGITPETIEKYQQELVKQASALPRCNIVAVALSKSFILSVDNMDQAMQFSNDYAPEHLILNVANAESYLEHVMNAGSVFVGPWSPERYLNH